MPPHDYHIHTSYSCDSRLGIDEACQAAIKLGLPEIGISDHFDLVPEDACYNFLRPDDWWRALEECRAQFGDALTIRAGVEIGEPHRFPDQVHRLLTSYPWDYAIGALHWVGDMLAFAPEYYEQPAEQAYRRYFRELETMVLQGEFDILAHFDIVKRYGFDNYGPYDPTQFEPDIRAVLQACVSRGVALEVNSSTLRRPIGELAPSRTVVRWYLQEGGRWVTLGSDAHQLQDVAAGLHLAAQEVSEAGFDHLARFVGRNPTSTPLP